MGSSCPEMLVLLDSTKGPKSDYWKGQGPQNGKKCIYIHIVVHIWTSGSQMFY